MECVVVVEGDVEDVGWEEKESWEIDGQTTLANCPRRQIQPYSLRMNKKFTGTISNRLSMVIPPFFIFVMPSHVCFPDFAWNSVHPPCCAAFPNRCNRPGLLVLVTTTG